ncbi:MAG: DUF4214 domain-containing protein [Acidimicrobiales bacterium]
MSIRKVPPIAAIATVATLAVAASLVALPSAPAQAIVGGTYQITSRVSVLPDGSQSGGGHGVAMTPDGRYTVFSMLAPTFPGAGPTSQVFRRDQWTGREVLVSAASSAGAVPNGTSSDPTISDDGKWIAFSSAASNLVETDTNAKKDVFLRNMDVGVTQLLSVSSSEVQGDGDSVDPSISGAGDKVAFDSKATNLVAGDTNGTDDVFVRSWVAGTTERVSVSTGSAQGNGTSSLPAMSGDGSSVAFSSGATNLVAGDTNGTYDVFERSLGLHTTTRVSLNGSTEPNGASSAPAISNTGAVVVFDSSASNLVAGDTNGDDDVFAWNRGTKAIERASVDAFGGQLGQGTWLGQAVSRDGNVVVWTSKDPAVTIPSGDGKAVHVYTRNLATDFTTLIDTRPDGKPGTDSYTLEVSTDQTGRRVGFASTSADLVRHDTNDDYDSFVTDTAVDIGPFASISAFVTQQYVDFTGAAPTASQLAEGIAKVTNGELSPERFIESLAFGAPFATDRAPVMRLYWAFFLRGPDPSGFTYWVNKKHGGASLNSIAESFAKSSEFKNTYGSLSNTAFVKLVYENVLQRGADAAGLSHWVAKLDAKALTRGAVMVQFSESSEGIRKIAPQTDVVLLNLGMMRTLPSALAIESWSNKVGYPAVPYVYTSTLLDLNAYAARF